MKILLLLGLTLLLGFKFEAPEDWQTLPLSSRMRVAEFKLPAADGEKDDATVAVFTFGMRMGGSADANVKRWLAQFDPKDGTPSIEVPLKDQQPEITFVDVAGTYVAETSPGSGEKLNKPGWRMIAAVVDGEGGMYFVKAIGPKATIEKNAEAIRAYIRSAKAE